MGLTDILKPRICELGKIKIGGLSAQVRKTATGKDWSPPEKYDHFVITTLHRDGQRRLIVDSELMKQLATDYADQDGHMRRLPIRLLSNELDDVMQSAWVWYGGKTVGARSDGVTVTWNNDPHNGRKLTTPKIEDWKPEFAELKDSKGNRLFKIHTIFNCVIGSKDSRWGGVYKFRTTSRITSDQLYGSLIQLGQLTGGILAGLPLLLVVRPMQVAPEGRPTTVYVVHVELRGPDLQAIQGQALQLAEYQVKFKAQIEDTRRRYRALLVAPGTENDDEPEDIQGEFAPEMMDPGPAQAVDPLAEQLTGVGPMAQPAAPDAPAEPKTPAAGQGGPETINDVGFNNEEGNGADVETKTRKPTNPNDPPETLNDNDFDFLDRNPPTPPGEPPSCVMS